MDITNYKKTISKRIVFGIILLITGLLIIFADISGYTKNEASMFGYVFFAAGAVRIVRYARILKNKKVLEKSAAAENDERNIMIYHRSLAAAALISVGLSGAGIFLLFLTGHEAEGSIVAYCLCGFLIIYNICYYITKKRY